VYPQRRQISLQFRSYVGPPQTSHGSGVSGVVSLGDEVGFRAADIVEGPWQSGRKAMPIHPPPECSVIYPTVDAETGRRMSKLAENLVRNCLRIRSTDNVTVFFYPHNLPLAEDIATECFRVGADALLNLYTDAYYTAYLRYLPTESLRQPSVYCRGLTELSTAQFWIGGAYDPSIFRKASAEKLAASDEGETEAHVDIARKRKVRGLSVDIGLATAPRAKAYGFALARWKRMMTEAASVSPAKLAADGKRVASKLATAANARITAPNGTDVELALAGRRAQVSDGVVDDEDIAIGALTASIPAGSVSVAPQERSAHGVVVGSLPSPWAGRSIRRLRWEFHDGRLTTFDGDANAKELAAVQAKATGDKDRIAGLSVGLNPKAEFGFLQNAIVRGAITVSVGANEDFGGVSKSSFWFPVTVPNATLEINGQSLVQDGALVV
jgi:aminopeptidase